MNCSVCAHPSLTHIDRGLEAGVPLRSLAAQYGLSPSALHRHTRHLARRLAQESSQEGLAHLEALLAKLELLEARLDRLFRHAEEARSLYVALGCLQESLRLLAFQERLRHSLPGPPGPVPPQGRLPAEMSRK